MLNAELVHSVKEQVSLAARESGRQSDDVTLLVATKNQSIEKLRECVELGLNVFGENYVQEALVKQQELADLKIKWHLIGPLQSKKCKQVMGHFELIHSIDRLSTVRQLSQRQLPQRCQDILIQVNVGEEVTKSGLVPRDLWAFVDEIQKLSGICMRGFMTMPPVTKSEREARKYFASLRELAENCQKRVDLTLHPLSELSMGTSHDFIAAIKEGSTIIRLGSLLLGPRE